MKLILVQAVCLGNVETQLGLYSACNFGMQYHDSSDSALAITSLGALRRIFVDFSPCPLAAASFLYW